MLMNKEPNTDSLFMSGSIFGEGAVLDYIMIFVLAFLLGACVTVFCLRLKQWQKSGDEEDDKS